MPAIPQYVPQEYCLSCKGCCRFSEADSEWQPKVTSQELDPSGPFKKGDLDEKGRVKSDGCPKGFLCRFLNEPDHHCRIYDRRPLECRIYPFVVVGGRQVHVHLACPFVQENIDTKGFEEFVQVLKTFLKEEAGEDIKMALPELDHEYDENRDELRLLFDL